MLIFYTLVFRFKQAKQDLRAAYEALSQPEKDSLTKGGKRAKQESNSTLSKADESKQVETPVAVSSPIEPVSDLCLRVYKLA